MTSPTNPDGPDTPASIKPGDLVDPAASSPQLLHDGELADLQAQHLAAAYWYERRRRAQAEHTLSDPRMQVPPQPIPPRPHD